MIEPRLLNGPFITVIEYENTKRQLSESPIQTTLSSLLLLLSPSLPRDDQIQILHQYGNSGLRLLAL